MRLPEPQLIDPGSVPVLNWGVLGPGNIAQTFVSAVQQFTNQRFSAVASRTPHRAEAFAKEFGIPDSYESYEQLLADPNIDAVYVASRQGDHFDHGMLAIQHGKHVLIEKPLTYSAKQAAELLAAGAAAGVLVMEAMWTRYLPQASIISQLLESGELGGPQLFTASFCVDNRAIPRLWEKGGGGIVFDMGIYPISQAQHFLGNPSSIVARGKVRPDGMDEESVAILGYQSGAQAVLTMSGISSLPITASCSFENGLVLVKEPFLAPTGISLRNKEFYFEEQSWFDEFPPRGHQGLSYQATAFAKYVAEGRIESEIHSHADTVASIAVAEEITSLIGASPF